MCPGRLLVQHHDLRVEELIRQAGAVLIYIPHYSCDMSVVEFAFRQYKAYLKRHYSGHKRDLASVHAGALRCVTRADMCAYYRKVGYYRNVTPNIIPDPDDHNGMCINIIMSAVTASAMVCCD